MISAISNITPAQPAAQATAVQQSPAKALTQTAADTVQISSAAKALSQENLETPAQTAQEARGGDVQAIRRLAKQTASKVSSK
jgi:hypothetical protein